MNEDSPYGDLFDPPTGTGDIDFENPTSQDLARIQQDPNLQMQYLQTIMSGGGSDQGYFGDYKAPEGQHGRTDPQQMIGKALEHFFDSGYSVEQFLNLSRQQQSGGAASLSSILFGGGYAPGNFGNEMIPSPEVFGFSGNYAQNPDDYAELMNYLEDLQEGMRKLQGGDFGIDSLQRELDLAERGVTGPGGLTQQKGSFADILQQNINRRRQDYVPQEKKSRYGKVTGGDGGVDPTSGYLSGVGSDVSAYGTSIAGVDKSIYDILYGTDAGSIHDIYSQYGEGVKGSLMGIDGGLWYE